MNTRTARVHQVSVSPAGGVPKHAVPQARVEANGIVGDAVRHPDIHGGPTRAVCLYSLELIRQLQADGHPIAPGTAGENLTIEGLDWSQVVPGATLAIGTDVRLEVLSYTAPCKTIRESFRDGQFKRISQQLHPGSSRVYARVVREGTVRAGDPVTLEAATVTHRD
jgi:MOSC domain-containing protein YiiM